SCHSWIRSQRTIRPSSRFVSRLVRSKAARMRRSTLDSRGCGRSYRTANSTRSGTSIGRSYTSSLRTWSTSVTTSPTPSSPSPPSTCKRRASGHNDMDAAALGLPILIALIAVALLFDFLNGLHDAANSIATVVATRVLRPQTGVLWAAFFNFIAFAVFGLHVAQTVGTGIVSAGV